MKTLLESVGNGPHTLALRWPGFLAAHEATLSGALQLVAQDAGRTGAVVSPRAHDFDVERRSRARPDGSGLATRRLG